MTLFDANSSLFHAESTFPRKSCERTLSFESTAQNLASDTFHGRLVIVNLHRFENPLQFVHQFWIEFAHAEGEFHADGLNAWELFDIYHVLETEIKEVCS